MKAIRVVASPGMPPSLSRSAAARLRARKHPAPSFLCRCGAGLLTAGVQQACAPKIRGRGFPVHLAVSHHRLDLGAVRAHPGGQVAALQLFLDRSAKAGLDVWDLGRHGGITPRPAAVSSVTRLTLQEKGPGRHKPAELSVSLVLSLFGVA
jgi:hypothetical protein